MSDQFLYLFDPLCGWCYGASEGIAALAGHADVNVEILPTGLFAGAGARTLDGSMREHILASDQRIATLTGAVFGDAYRQHIVGSGRFRLDSAAATLVLTAVAQSAPGRELDMLGTIQRARYIDGRDIADPNVLVDLLRHAGLMATADAIDDPSAALFDANAARLDRARSIMRRFDINGVPSLLRDKAGVLTPIDASPLYRNPLSLVPPIGVA